jgi:hypothetical protein
MSDFGYIDDNHHGGIENDDQERLTGFAHRIIKECLNECWYDATPKEIADNIRMKFSITELDL